MREALNRLLDSAVLPVGVSPRFITARGATSGMPSTFPPLPFPSIPFPSLQFPSLPFPPLPHGLAKLDPRMLLRSNYCRLAASKTDTGPQQCARIFPKHALQARLAQTLLSVDIFPGECRFAGMLPEMLTHGSTGGSSYKYAGGDRVHRKKNHNPRKFGKR